MPHVLFMVLFAGVVSSFGGAAMAQSGAPGAPPANGQVLPAQPPAEAPPPRMQAPLPQVPGIAIPEREVEPDHPGIGGGCRYQPRTLELIV